MTDAAMDNFVGTVRARADILSVVSGYVNLKRKHGNYWGCCPFHNEKTASFSVSPDKGFFYCFGCHVGGDVFKFISLIENVSYFEAIKLQAEKLGIALPKRNLSPAEIERNNRLKDLKRLQDMAKNFFHNCLTRTAYGEPARAYLKRRGISAETVTDFAWVLRRTGGTSCRRRFKNAALPRNFWWRRLWLRNAKTLPAYMTGSAGGS